MSWHGYVGFGKGRRLGRPNTYGQLTIGVFVALGFRVHPQTV